MSDLFQDAVPDDYIVAVADVMLRTPWHTYQVLTKRSERMADLLSSRLQESAKSTHIWWGVSVENRKHGLPRIDHLRTSSAATKFLSIEPLLEDLGAVNLEGIDWVIVGGESGAGARPMEREWVDAIRQACRRSRSRFFFKQWGGVQKGKHGRVLNGRTYDEMPARSMSEILPRRQRLDLLEAVNACRTLWDESPLIQLGRAQVVA